MSLAAINAAGRRGFMHDNFAETLALRLQFFPKPRRHVLDRRIFQAFDLVQIRMIQHLQERFHGRSNFGMIVNPAAFVIDISFDRNLDFKAVTMHAPAFMALRSSWQSLRRFKSEIFRESCAHDAREYHPSDCVVIPNGVRDLAQGDWLRVINAYRLLRL